MRRRLRQARRALDPATRGAEHLAVAAALDALLRTWPGRQLAAYLASPEECSLDALLAGRLPVLLPRVDGDHLAWHQVHDLAQCPPGYRCIREPDPARCPALRLASGAVLLVPGTGFGADGRRLGQGGGFYDRVLAGHQGPTIGVGYSCQREDNLPEQAHDCRLSHVILGGALVRG